MPRIVLKQYCFVEFRTFGGVLTNAHLFYLLSSWRLSSFFATVMQVFWLLKQIPFPENVTRSTDVGIDSSEDPGLCLELLGVTVIEGVKR